MSISREPVPHVTKADRNTEFLLSGSGTWLCCVEISGSDEWAFTSPVLRVSVHVTK